MVLSNTTFFSLFSLCLYFSFLSLHSFYLGTGRGQGMGSLMTAMKYQMGFWIGERNQKNTTTWMITGLGGGWIGLAGQWEGLFFFFYFFSHKQMTIPTLFSTPTFFVSFLQYVFLTVISDILFFFFGRGSELGVYLSSQLVGNLGGDEKKRSAVDISIYYYYLLPVHTICSFSVCDCRCIL
ncbi:hypothetical protein B0T21DRAFT_146582 [Apiosordaria backusii]|uniref:Uncharacterized protein n=1 Tax=Apiosordaria backusii TaxID=314023 RepID=A0AA40BSQ6_9PEZI|nr:hypothetical protein B0T21DRAFT_146582 [Apiosordaria backusii]